MVRNAIILVLGLVLTGCIGIDRPAVSITQVRLAEVSDAGGRIEFDLLVENPNDEELPMPTVSYEVDVVGARTFTFTDRPYAAVSRNGETALTFAAAVRGVNLKGKRVTIDGEMLFEPQGEIRRVFYDNNYPLPRSSFSGEGVLE